MNQSQMDALREENLKILAEVLQDKDTSPAVRIQAVQAREKIIDTLEDKQPETDTALLDVIKAIKE